MRFPTRVAAFAFAAAVVLGGCGGSTGGGLSATARTRLTTLVEGVRRAADSGDRQAAQQALANLQGVVSSYESHGDISSARAAQILTAAAGVERNLGLIPTTTTTTATTTPPPPGHGHSGNGPGNSKKGDKSNGGGG